MAVLKSSVDPSALQKHTTCIHAYMHAYMPVYRLHAFVIHWFNSRFFDSTPADFSSHANKMSQQAYGFHMITCQEEIHTDAECFSI